MKFDGILRLPDGMLAVFDVDNSTRLIKRVGDPGAIRFLIRADSAERASRVDLVIGPEDGVAALSRISDFPLPLVGGASGGLTSAAALDLILSGYDLPMARLANAIKLVIDEWWSDSSPRATILRASRINRISLSWRQYSIEA